MRAGLGVCLYNKALVVKLGDSAESPSARTLDMAADSCQQDQQHQHPHHLEHQGRVVDASWPYGPESTPTKQGPRREPDTRGQSPAQPASAAAPDVSTLMGVDSSKAVNILISLQV